MQSHCGALPEVEEVIAPHQLSREAPLDVQASGSIGTTPNVTLITVHPPSPELPSTSQPQSRRRLLSAAHRPTTSFAVQKPQDSLAPGTSSLTLHPSNLLNISAEHYTCRSATTPRRLARRSLHQAAGRVDIVATFSMTIFIVILFFDTFSYVISVALINSRSVCVITAGNRILMFVIIIASMGLGAVVSPLALVLFSADFRKAFVSTCGRAARYFRRSER